MVTAAWHILISAAYAMYWKWNFVELHSYCSLALSRASKANVSNVSLRMACRSKGKWHTMAESGLDTCDLHVEFLLVFLLHLWDPTFILPIPNCLNTKFPQFQFFVCPFVCLSTCSLLISSVMCMYVLTLWVWWSWFAWT